MIKEIPCKPNHECIGFEEISGGYRPIFERIKPIGTLVTYKQPDDIKQVGPVCTGTFQLENTALVVSDELMLTYNGHLRELKGRGIHGNTFLPEFLLHLKEMGIFWDGFRLYVSVDFPKYVKQFCESDYTLINLELLVMNLRETKII